MNIHFILFLLRYMLITIISRARFHDLDYWAEPSTIQKHNLQRIRFDLNTISKAHIEPMMNRTKFTFCISVHCSRCLFLTMSANQNCFDLEQLSQFVGDPDESHFGGPDVDLLAGAEQLVALRPFKELLGADFAQKLLRRTGPAVDLLQQAVFWFDLERDIKDVIQKDSTTIHV